jgi:hypothetical protein
VIDKNYKHILLTYTIICNIFKRTHLIIEKLHKNDTNYDTIVSKITQDKGQQIMNKDYIYQSVIGVLVVSLGFAFYKLYSVNNIPNEINKTSEEIHYVNVRDEKYQQQIKEQFERKPRELNYDKITFRNNVKENLQNIQASYSQELCKSIEMIQEYNKQNPNNPIIINEYDFKADDMYSQIEPITSTPTSNIDEKIEYENASIQEEEKTSNGSYMVQNSNSTPTSVSSKGSHQSEQTGEEENNEVVSTTSASTEVSNTQTQEKTVDTQKYVSTINDIKQMIHSINNSLE